MPRKFGRISPKVLPNDRTDLLHFAAFLKPQLKPPPTTCNWNKAGLVYPMSLNDELGDCGPAACAHQIQAWTANTQASAKVLTDAEVLACYEAVSGYNGTPATDVGVNLETLMMYWKDTGIGGNKILASASVDPAMLANIQWAVIVFGGVQLGINLPQSALDETDANQPWTVVKGSPIVGGHDVAAIGFDPEGFVAISWGQLVKITYAFVAKYVEEIWCVVDPSWLDSKGLAPNLLNAGSLMVDVGLI